MLPIASTGKLPFFSVFFWQPRYTFKNFLVRLYRVTDVTIFRVVAGEHSLSVVSGLEQNRDVSGYLMHPDYDTRYIGFFVSPEIYFNLILFTYSLIWNHFVIETAPRPTTSPLST